MRPIFQGVPLSANQRDASGPVVVPWESLPDVGIRDRLVSAIIERRKVSTAALALDYAIGRELLPQPGHGAVLIDSRDRPVAVIEFAGVRSTLLGEVDLSHAVDEGEGHATVETWRAAHEAHWHSEQVRAELGNPSFTVNDTAAVVLERFRVIERL